MRWYYSCAHESKVCAMNTCNEYYPASIHPPSFPLLFLTKGVALVISLALLPVSFESDFMSQFCGRKASYYYRGMCTIDWGLYVAMVITACTLYLPSLAVFAMNISDGLKANVCC